jgi:transcriptional regulator with XRE-family HTH domain
VAKRFAQNLSHYREQTGLSQEALASRAGIHRTQIGELLHGKQVPRLDTVVRLAGALGVTVAQLADGLHWEPSDASGEYRINPLDD